jgi:uncharacterized protein with ParB-like and HNH nuclease domain
MEASTSKLLDYLKNDKINEIPVYQRNYSWDKEQCEQLFNDVLHAGANENIELHFIGSVIVVIGGNATKTLHSIVDGQQRITTTTLLLKAILDTGKLDSFVKPTLFIEGDENEGRKLFLNKDDDSAFDKIANNETNFSGKDRKTKVYKNYKVCEIYLSQVLANYGRGFAFHKYGLKKQV